MSQYHSTVVWKFKYFTSSGETEITKLKASGGYSSKIMLNMIYIFPICGLFSSTLLYNFLCSDMVFSLFFSSIFYFSVLISVFVTEVIFRYLLLRSPVSLPL